MVAINDFLDARSRKKARYPEMLKAGYNLGMDDFRLNLRKSTLGAASAFIDDMAHFREVLAKPKHNLREIRLLSLPLRRLILNGELQNIAAGRVYNKILINSPDLSYYYRQERRENIGFFVAGETQLFGTKFGSMSGRLLATATTNLTNARLRRIINKNCEDPIPKDVYVELSVDSFIKQRVCYLGGKWVTRGDAILNLAVYGSVAHSKIPQDEKHLSISRMRNGIIIKDGGEGGIAIELDKFWEVGTTSEQTEFVRREGAMDAVLIQMLTTITALTNSPHIVELERLIRLELS